MQIKKRRATPICFVKLVNKRLKMEIVARNHVRRSITCSVKIL